MPITKAESESPYPPSELDRDDYKFIVKAVTKYAYGLQPADRNDLIQRAAESAMNTARMGKLPIDRTEREKWLRRLCFCKLIDLRRSFRSRLSMLASALMITSVFNAPLHNSNDEIRELIDISLNSLSLEQREVFELTYFAEMEGPEIAEMLKIPLGTVRSRLKAAHSKVESRFLKAGLISSTNADEEAFVLIVKEAI